MNVKEAIENRYTVKAYKKGTSITDEDLNELINAAWLAPSSNNLQQVRVIALRSPESRKKYATYYRDFNQERLADAEVNFVFVGVPYNMMHANNGKLIKEAYLNHIPGIDQQSIDNGAQGILDYYDFKSIYGDTLDIYDASIMFSFIALRAMDMGKGSTPMLGIDGDRFTVALREEGLISGTERVLLAMSVGTPDTDNPAWRHERVRMPKEDQFKVL